MSVTSKIASSLPQLFDGASAARVQQKINSYSAAASLLSKMWKLKKCSASEAATKSGFISKQF